MIPSKFTVLHYLLLLEENFMKRTVFFVVALVMGANLSFASEGYWTPDPKNQKNCNDIAYVYSDKFIPTKYSRSVPASITLVLENGQKTFGFKEWYELPASIIAEYKAADGTRLMQDSLCWPGNTHDDYDIPCWNFNYCQYVEFES